MDNKFTIEIVEPILKSDRDVFNTFSEKHWGEHDSNGEEYDFFGTPTFCVVAKYENEIVGLALCFIRDCVFSKKSISYGAIGGVVTHTGYRHKGIATKIVRKIIDELKRREIDISILCTDIEKLGGLYAKAGFTPIGRPYYFLNSVEETKCDPAGMIAPCANNEKFKMILNSTERLYIGVSNF